MATTQRCTNLHRSRADHLPAKSLRAVLRAAKLSPASTFKGEQNACAQMWLMALRCAIAPSPPVHLPLARVEGRTKSVVDHNCRSLSDAVKPRAALPITPPPAGEGHEVEASARAAGFVSLARPFRAGFQTGAGEGSVELRLEALHCDQRLYSTIYSVRPSTRREGDA